MVVYEERAARLDGAVVWTRTGSTTGHRVVPDGCMDIVWNDGELVVAGPDTHAYSPPSRPGGLFAGLRFAPGTGPAVLGVPAHELRDQRIPLSALWPSAQTRRLTERIADAPDRAYVGDLLETAALRWAEDRRAEPPEPLLAEIVTALERGMPVAALARRLALSERQLHRRCLNAFGYGPKTLSRVLRMNRALALARSGLSFATVATTTGYADQAHLTRDTKALTGVPLGALVG